MHAVAAVTAESELLEGKSDAQINVHTVDFKDAKILSTTPQIIPRVAKTRTFFLMSSWMESMPESDPVADAVELGPPQLLEGHGQASTGPPLFFHFEHFLPSVLKVMADPIDSALYVHQHTDTASKLIPFPATSSAVSTRKMSSETSTTSSR